MEKAEEAEVVLRLDGITKRFGALVANDGISFDLRKGEVIALLGENGAGKTTLMNILFGHYTADAGSVEVFGQPKQRDLMFLIQPRSVQIRQKRTDERGERGERKRNPLFPDWNKRCPDDKHPQ